MLPSAGTEAAANRFVPLTLHGITHAGMAHAIGPAGADFAGTRVHAITQGSVAALVSEARWFSHWKLPPPFPQIKRSISPSPVLSALASLTPMVPVAGDLRFPSEPSLRKLLADRELELDEIVLRHSGFLECEVRAEFDQSSALADLSNKTSITVVDAINEAEIELVRRTLQQTLAGRQGEFVARLRRILANSAADASTPIPGSRHEVFARCVLIARSSCKEFRAALTALARDAGVGARLIVSEMRPPIHFRRLEVRGPNITEIDAAREALGVANSTDRAAIRIAYRRTIERFSAQSGTEQQEQMARLNAQFSLLELVADGQIKAARGAPDAPVQLDAQSLSQTWLLRFKQREASERVA